MNKANYPSVLQSIKINQMIFPNRIIFPAVNANYSNSDGSVSDELIHFYSEIAKGGCGLVMTGSATVSKDSVSSDRIMRVDSDKYIPGLKKLFSSIENQGSVPGIQLMHSGRQALKSVTGYDLLAPSAIPCPVMSTLDPTYHVREMTLEEILRVQNDFVDAAIRAFDAGAKVIEIHAAHGYLLGEFLSPYANYRRDEYGGSVENRARMICEILERIRDNLRQRVVMSVRVSGNEFVKGGLVPEDFHAIVPLLEKAGMNFLNVSVGVVETVNCVIPDASYGEAPFIDIAETIKQFTTVPVCTVGSIPSLEIAEKIIAENKADLVAIGRSQIADPYLIKKSIVGDEKNIRRCLRCNKCLYWSTGDAEMRCVMNPWLTHEAD